MSQEAQLYTVTDIVIRCSCPICEIKPVPEHQHQIFLDNSIDWVSSKKQKMRELHDKAKAYGMTVEQVMKKEAEGSL